jgi:hypothetical protein
VAKYTNEELDRIQEQYAELVHGTEMDPTQSEYEEEAFADDDARDEESPPS